MQVHAAHLQPIHGKSEFMNRRHGRQMVRIEAICGSVLHDVLSALSTTLFECRNMIWHQTQMNQVLRHLSRKSCI